MVGDTNIYVCMYVVTGINYPLRMTLLSWIENVKLSPFFIII